MAEDVLFFGILLTFAYLCTIQQTSIKSVKKYFLWNI